MIKVKVSTAFPDWPLIRQTPFSEGIWGDFQFYINQDVDECDYWVVYDSLFQTETVYCSPNNTILITGEPPDIKKYNPEFIDQFGMIITCHRNINHPNVIYTQQALPWMIGWKSLDSTINTFTKDYDELKSNRILEKSKLISVIASNKKITSGHRKRLEFVKKIKNVFGDDIDIFGRGYNEISDKWDAIYKYKYHIVLENSAVLDYWTEKIADCFLSEAFPLYYGCPNIFDYFSENSLIQIDINNYADSIKNIQVCIENRMFEKNIENIRAQKSKILDIYNLFPMICDIISKNESFDKTNKQQIHLKDIPRKPSFYENFISNTKKIFNSQLLEKLS